MNMFDVLKNVCDLHDAREACTAAKIASRVGVSVYMSRKLLHTMAELGLISWSSALHRPDVLKRLYYPTEIGQRVHFAYTGQLSRILARSS